MYFTESEKERYYVEKGYLLVCEGGDYGRSAVWNYDYGIYIQNHIHRLIPIIELEIYFFYYIFYFYKITNNIPGKGIGIKSISTKEMSKIIIPLPPIDEQKRIVIKIKSLLECCALL